MLTYIINISLFIFSYQNGDTVINKNQNIFTKFPSTKSVNLTDFISYNKGAISRMYLNDNTLIVYDWKGGGGHFFHEYELKSKSEIRLHIPNGSGKGKALGSLSAGIYKNELWMYDKSLGKIIFSSLKKKSSSSDTAQLWREYPFTPEYYNIQFLDDLKVIGSGNYTRQAKLQEVDLNSGKILADYGKIDNLPRDVPFYSWKRYNEAFMDLKSTGDKIVLAHRLSDQIEIFDLRNHKETIIHGPENYKPEFVPFKSQDDIDLITRNEKSRYAFTQVMSTEKFIYVLYSGNNMSTGKFLDFAKSLFVYDWNGKPIKRINFDRYVSGFAVSNDDETLYAYDPISKHIVTSKI